MIDKSKTYRTRDGREVRIYATDAGGERPVHGAVKSGDGWTGLAWRADGSAFSCHRNDNDLIEVVPLIERWAVITPECGWHCSFSDEKSARAVLSTTRRDFRIVHLREVRE